MSIFTDAEQIHRFRHLAVGGGKAPAGSARTHHLAVELKLDVYAVRTQMPMASYGYFPNSRPTPAGKRAIAALSACEASAGSARSRYSMFMQCEQKTRWHDVAIAPKLATAAAKG